MRADPFKGRPEAERPPRPTKQPSTQTTAARVRVRLKGSTSEGHLYHGQHLIQRCRGCGPHAGVNGNTAERDGRTD